LDFRKSFLRETEKATAMVRSGQTGKSLDFRKNFRNPEWGIPLKRRPGQRLSLSKALENQRIFRPSGKIVADERRLVCEIPVFEGWRRKVAWM